MTNIERISNGWSTCYAASGTAASRTPTANPRYLRYSNAVSALLWLIDDLGTEGIG